MAIAATKNAHATFPGRRPGVHQSSDQRPEPPQRPGESRRPYFGDDARTGVLNVFSHPRAMQSAMEVHEEILGNMGVFMLYGVWEAFGDFFRPPPPRPDLFLKSWQRVGQPPFFISIA